MRLATPFDLVNAIKTGEPAALQELDRRCSAVVRRVVEVIAGRFGVKADPDRLTRHALRWVAMKLRTMKPSEFPSSGADRDWDFFKKFVAVSVSRLLRQPSTAPTAPVRSNAAPLPESMPFAISDFFKPYDVVGGDWWTATPAADALWVVVADVCGKSWPAYILARGLEPLWDLCLVKSPADAGALLEALDAHLQPCLPEGLFVEMTIARFSVPQCRVQVTAAGRSLVLRRDVDSGTVDGRVLGGFFLGAGFGVSSDQIEWPVQAGDEVLLASDGLIDQENGERRLEAALNLLTLPPGEACTLHEAVMRLLRDALAKHLQSDDITVVTVQSK